MAVQKDAEELFNILFLEQNTTVIAEELEDAEELPIVFQPSNDGEDSDKDNAPSDNVEACANFKDVGREVLSQSAKIRIINKDGKRDLDIESATPEDLPCSSKRSKKQKTVRKWLPEQLKNTASSCKFEEGNEAPAVVDTITKEGMNPVDLFKLRSDDEIMNYICRETVKCASQKGGFQFVVTVEELNRYFVILLLSGYNKMPFRRMYWETRSDANNFLVSQCISRNRFLKIYQYLHFNGNMSIDYNDRVYKIRPIIDHLNACFGQFFQPCG